MQFRTVRFESIQLMIKNDMSIEIREREIRADSRLMAYFLHRKQKLATKSVKYRLCVVRYLASKLQTRKNNFIFLTKNSDFFFCLNPRAIPDPDLPLLHSLIKFYIRRIHFCAEQYIINSYPLLKSIILNSLKIGSFSCPWKVF